MVDFNIGKNRMDFLGMFKENNGQFSTLRFLVTMIVLVFLFNWSYLCISTGTLISFSWEEIVLVISPLFAKVTQKKFEEGKGGS